jgi:hypothetical protein
VSDRVRRDLEKYESLVKDDKWSGQILISVASLREIKATERELQAKVERLEVFKDNAIYVLNVVSRKKRTLAWNAGLADKLLDLDESGDLYEEQPKDEGGNDV